MTEFEARLIKALERIGDLLEKSLPLRQKPPNYQALLENFNQYDWHSIGAEIETTDSYGVASVIWQGSRYKRRSPDNAYGACVYFSRCIGKSSEGTNQYERLITFEPYKDLGVQPISRKAEEAIK
jgi:DdrB-like protein